MIGQEFDIVGTVERFHAAHEKEFTFRLDNPVEAVNFHLIAYGLIDKPRIEASAIGPADAAPACCGTRPVDLDVLGVVKTTLYERSRLTPGMRFSGPAIVEEEATSTVVFPGQTVAVDPWGSLHIELTSGR